MPDYTADGSLHIQTDIFNTTEFSVVYNVDLDSQWNVRVRYEKDFEFQWDVGEQPYRYYQIRGECLYPPDCENAGIETNDPLCPSGGGSFFQIAAAQSIGDLCEQLRKKFLTWPNKWKISSIKRWSRPIYLDTVAAEEEQGVDHDCNLLEAQSICHIPECLEFCITEDHVVDMAINVSIIDTFLTYEGGGGFAISGQAGQDYTRPVAEGGMELSASAEVTCSHYFYEPDSGLILSGESEITCSDWNYTPNSGLYLSGTNYPTSSAWHYTGGGTFYTGGSASTRVALYYTPSRPLLDLEANPILVANYITEGSGELVLGGSSTCLPSHYSYEPDSGLQLQGDAYLKSSNYTYEPDSGLELISKYQLSYRYTASGSLTLEGDVPLTQNKSYTPSGTLVLGGELLVNESSAYSWIGNGSLELGGEAEDNFENFGILTTGMAIEGSLPLLEPVYPAVIKPLHVLLPTTGIVNNDCDCNPIDIKLIFGHNLTASGVLKEFLIRNKLNLPKQFNLIYNSLDKNWRSTYHFKGAGKDAGMTEEWRVIFEWGCTDTVGENQLDGDFWRFSILIRRKKVQINKKDETRLLYLMPKPYACKDDEVDFRFKIDPRSGEITLPVDFLAEQALLTDEIGIFDTLFWRNNDLDFRVTELFIEPGQPTLNISPLIPEPPITPLLAEGPTFIIG